MPDFAEDQKGKNPAAKAILTALTDKEHGTLGNPSELLNKLQPPLMLQYSMCPNSASPAVTVS